MMRAYVYALAAALSVAAGAVQATPVTYTFTGTASIVVCTLCNGTDNTDLAGAFSLVVNSDTSQVDVSGLPFSRLNNVSGTFTLGSFTDTLTGISLVANAGQTSPFFPANIQFFNSTFDNGDGFDDNVDLLGYDLTKSIGPVIAPTDSESPTFNTVGDGFSTTDGQTVEFVQNSDQYHAESFQATVLPEPLTLSMFGAGLAGAVAMRRRRKPKA